MSSIGSATHPTALPLRGNREEDASSAAALDAQLHTIKDTSPDPLLASTLPSLPHPPTRLHHQLSTSPPASGLPLTQFHSSIQAWLDQRSPLTPSSTTTQIPLQCNQQLTSLKRKRSPSSDPAESTPSIPLTRKALRQHLALTMSSNPSTTVDNIFTPPRPVTTTESSLQTPSNVTKPSVAHGAVRDYLKQHAMYIDTQVLQEPGMAAFREKVMSVADEQRPSGRKPESELKWQNRTKKLAVYNEATMLEHVLPLLIKDGRHLSVQGPATEQWSSNQGLDNVWEDFDNSGLDWTVDQEFHNSFLPNAYSQIGYEEKIAKELAKQKGMKNPKPDRAYGFAIDSIPPPQGLPALLRDETQALLDATPNLRHVFFLLEAVSSAGSMTKAINQACRGGTVAVVIQRRLLAGIGQPQMDEGPDQKTYVYTATIDDSNMSFWVNFAFVHVPQFGEPYVTYHMELVYTYALRSNDAVLYLRRVCHNILDWGVRTRRPMLETRCQQMYEFERRVIEADAARVQELAAAAEQEQGGKGKKRKYGTPGKVSQGGL